MGCSVTFEPKEFRGAGRNIGVGTDGAGNVGEGGIDGRGGLQGKGGIGPSQHEAVGRPAKVQWGPDEAVLDGGQIVRAPKGIPGNQDITGSVTDVHGHSIAQRVLEEACTGNRRT